MSDRHTTNADRVILEQWIKDDPHHAGKVKPEFFYLPSNGSECFAWEDAAGTVFYYRISRVLRVDIQFQPEIDPERTRKALQEGFTYLEQKARAAGFWQMIFESSSSLLIRFCKRFKFQQSPNEFIAFLQREPEDKPINAIEKAALVERGSVT